MDRIFKKGQTAWVYAAKAYGHSRKKDGKRGASKAGRRFGKAIIRSILAGN